MPLIPLCPASELKAKGAQAEMAVCILIHLEMFVCVHSLLKRLRAHYFLRLENKGKSFSVRLLLECEIHSSVHNSGACTLPPSICWFCSVSLRVLLQTGVTGCTS